MSNSSIPGAMPQQTVTPLQPGSTSIGNSAYKASQAQNHQQMALIGKSGGKRSKRQIKGGAGDITVPPVQAGSVNGAQTGANFKQLTELSATQGQQSIYDGASSPAQTAQIQAANNKNYSGGSKKGGNKWGCLSGGKQNKKHTNKTKGSKRTSKNKKTRKNKN